MAGKYGYIKKKRKGKIVFIITINDNPVIPEIEYDNEERAKEYCDEMNKIKEIKPNHSEVSKVSDTGTGEKPNTQKTPKTPATSKKPEAKKNIKSKSKKRK